jgi:Spy/CpxP family protein refolding chaperone
MNINRFVAATLLLTAAAFAQQATPCAGLPPGKHSLLERMTGQFGLTCEQQLKIEPLLHDEESVTKPLLKFSSLSAEEKQGIMLTIKLAARRQVRSLLTPEQQKGMDQEVDSVSSASKGGGKKVGGKKAVAPEPTVGLESEEQLSQAIIKYVALNPEEKKAMLLKVKQAARNDSALQLTPAQQKKLDDEIKAL